MSAGSRTEPEGRSTGAPPATMRALRIHAWGEPPHLEEVPTPEPGPGEVLVRTSAAVVAHLDLTVATGEFPLKPVPPYIPGVEGAGSVVALGEGVAEAAVELGGLTRLYGSGLGIRRPGCWAEYVVVPARSLRPVPDGLAPVTAAAIGSSGLTAWSALFTVGKFEPAWRLGVTGANGAVGSLVLGFARAAGAEACIGFVRDPGRATSIPDGVDVRSLHRGTGPLPDGPLDLLIDTVGGTGLGERTTWVRPGGALVIVGYTAGTDVTLDLPSFLAADVNLLPVNMMRRSQGAGETEAEILAQAAAGTVIVPTETVRADEVEAAIAKLKVGAVQGRLVVVW